MALDEANVANDDEARAFAMLGLAAVYLYTEEPGDEDKSFQLVSDVKQMIASKPYWRLNARCFMFEGEYAARKGDFDCALKLFQKSLDTLTEHKIEEFDFIDRLQDAISHIKGRRSTLQLPDEDFKELSRELEWLESWYPKYQRELRHYWWYYRNIDVTRNFRQTPSAKGFIAISDDSAEIEFAAEALSCLFDITMFSTRSKYKIIDNFDKYLLPVPNNTPFPFSIMRSIKDDSNDSVYTFHENTDGSTRGEYNYQMLKSSISFDKNRNPKPMTLSYHGVNLPEAVFEISPLVDVNGKCGLWWIGEDFGSGLFVLTIP